MACVMVGWKRPPYGECARRWHGSVWPREKKVERSLMRGSGQHAVVVSALYEGCTCSETRGRGWQGSSASCLD